MRLHSGHETGGSLTPKVDKLVEDDVRAEPHVGGPQHDHHVHGLTEEGCHHGTQAEVFSFLYSCYSWPG